MSVDTKDLRTKTKKEIADILTKTRAELGKVSTGVLNGEEKDLKKPGRLKKDLARILTVLKEQNA